MGGVAQLFSDSNKLVRVSEQIWFKVPGSPLSNSSCLIKSHVPEVWEMFYWSCKAGSDPWRTFQSSVQGES